MRDDPYYAFVPSEVNNIIAIMNFSACADFGTEAESRRETRRTGECLFPGIRHQSFRRGGSGTARCHGAALVSEDVRIEATAFLERRHLWHPRSNAQLAAGPGLEVLIYSRRNPTGKTVYWSESPDGTRIVTLSTGHYSEVDSVFSSNKLLQNLQPQELGKFFDSKEPIRPTVRPYLYWAAPAIRLLWASRKPQPGEIDPGEHDHRCSQSEFHPPLGKDPGFASRTECATYSEALEEIHRYECG